MVGGIRPVPAEEQSGPQSEAPAYVPSEEEVRRAEAESWVNGLTLQQTVASVIMSSIPTTDATQLAVLMEDTGLGGFILMGANVPETPEQLEAETSALVVDPQMPPLVAIDEEGGSVKRLPWDDLPGADTLRTEDPAATQEAFAARATLLADVGINVNFGIVADFTDDPDSFIYSRTFGNTAEEAAPRVAAAVQGEAGTVASTLKHFPGHGVAAGDSHTSVPSSDIRFDDWLNDVALPFQAGIDEGAELVMMGHLAYLSVAPTPASLTPQWYDIARRELEFEGLLITDDLAMLEASGLTQYRDAATNVTNALAAGADMALIIDGMSAEGITDLIAQVTANAEAGQIPPERLHDAAVRVAELRLLLAEDS